MKKCAYYFSIIALLFSFGSANAIVIDQSQTSYSGGIAFWEDERAVAQTFTAGISGELDSIVLDIGVSDASNLPADFEMHFTITEWSGSTQGTILGSVDLLADSSFISGVDDIIDFSSEGISLTSGSLYSLILTNDESYVDPAFPNGYFNTGVRTQWEDNLYTDGNMWTSIGGDWVEWSSNPSVSDLYFTTYMSEVPEPSTLLLLGMGLLGLCLTRRRS